MRKRKKGRRSGSQKDVYFMLPEESRVATFYLQLTVRKTIPKHVRNPEAIQQFFSKHGVARFKNEDGCFLEIWMGPRKVRVGTQADIDRFIRNYYERQGAAVPKDLTTNELILSYATASFTKCHLQRLDASDSGCDFGQSRLAVLTP